MSIAGNVHRASVGFDSVANCGYSIEGYGTPRTYGVTIGTTF